MKHPDDRLHDYLVGALSAQEDRALEAHLQTCAVCREELQRLNDMLEVMVEALPPVAPPAGLLSDVKARVLPPPAAPSVAPPAQVSARPFLPWALFAVTGLLLLASLTQVARTRQELGQARGQGEQVAAGLATDGAALLTIDSPTSGRLGTAVLLPNDRVLYVLLRDPPKAAAYQVWGVSSDGVTSLGLARTKVFEVRHLHFSRLRLSLEPAQGSPAPTRVLAENELPPAP